MKYTVAMLTILAIECLSIFWLNDSELTAICVGSGLLVGVCRALRI